MNKKHNVVKENKTGENVPSKLCVPVTGTQYFVYLKFCPKKAGLSVEIGGHETQS